MMKRRSRIITVMLFLPVALTLTLLLIWPLVDLISRSFTDPRGVWVFYERFIAIPSYIQVLIKTLIISSATAGICLVLGYAVAFKMTQVGPAARALIIVCILLPFWTNLLVRSYGWILILNSRGVINTLLMKAGIITEPLDIIYNEIGVLIGLTQIMLPYMILPLYAVMTKLDKSVTRASRSLGAGPAYTFFKVYFPLTAPGVMAGLLLVFTLSLGFFVIPALLGGTRGTMFAQLIEFNINGSLNWGMAAALSTSLLVTTLALYWIGDRWFNLGSIWGVQK